MAEPTAYLRSTPAYLATVARTVRLASDFAINPTPATAPSMANPNRGVRGFAILSRGAEA